MCQPACSFCNPDLAGKHSHAWSEQDKEQNRLSPCRSFQNTRDSRNQKLYIWGSHVLSQKVCIGHWATGEWAQEGNCLANAPPATQHGSLPTVSVKTNTVLTSCFQFCSVKQLRLPHHRAAILLWQWQVFCNTKHTYSPCTHHLLQRRREMNCGSSASVILQAAKNLPCLRATCTDFTA